MHRKFEEIDENMLFYKNCNISGVIFDIDGTLIDSLSFYHVYLNKGLEGQPILRCQNPMGSEISEGV